MSQRSTGSCTCCTHANAFPVMLFVQTFPEGQNFRMVLLYDYIPNSRKETRKWSRLWRMSDIILYCLYLHGNWYVLYYTQIMKICITKSVSRRIYILSTKVPTFFLVVSVLQIQLLGYKIYPTYYRMHAFIIPRYAPDIRYITTIDGCGDGWHGYY